MITGSELERLLPQSKPVLMIDTLISSDENSTNTSLFIEPDNIFVQNGKLSEAGIIENIAQTAAARTGLESTESSKPVRTGFIASVKNLKIRFLPEIQKKILTEIYIKTVIGDITVISAKSFVDKKILAECEMTIILSDSPKNS